MNIFSVILSTVSIFGLTYLIVKNICLIIKTCKNKSKSSQDNEGGDN